MPRLTRALAGVVATLLALFLPGFLSGVATAAPQSAASTAKPLPKGLFGDTDPTYDGVYRQSLALIALHTAGVTAGKASIQWLRDQQCPDGGFIAYRASTSIPCKKSKEDTNSTSLAIQALAVVGSETDNDPGRTAQAAQWLREQQRPDGGFPFYPGDPSDTNSTGLAVSALAALNEIPGYNAHGKQPLDFLLGEQVGCQAPAAQRGAFDYQAKGSPKPNAAATAQAVIGLLPEALPIRPSAPRNVVPTLTCPQPAQPATRDMAEAGAGYLARALQANGGVLPSPTGNGPDYGTTAEALLALAATATGHHEIQAGLTYFEKHTDAWVKGPNGKDQAAPLATLVLVAYGTHGDARNFGGSNLIKRLRNTEVGGVTSVHPPSPAAQSHVNVGLVVFVIVAGLVVIGVTVAERRRPSAAPTTPGGT